MEKPSNEFIEIFLRGEEILPEKIKAKELAEILISIEESILPIVIKRNPNMPLEDIIIGLVNIDRGSAKLKFSSTVPPIVVSAFLLLSSAVAKNDFKDIPIRSIEQLQKLSDFTRKKNCVAEFRTTASNKPLAQITPSSKIEIPESSYLQGETTLYGIIERVGGIHPKVTLRLRNNLVFCDIDKELAKKLGHSLYSWVGVSGIAKWNPEDYLVESFRIQQITEYRDISISTAMNELSSIVGRYWKEEMDIIKKVSKLREEGY